MNKLLLFILFVFKIAYVFDCLIFSSKRLDKRIRDTSSLSSVINNKTIKYKELIKNLIILPAQLKRKNIPTKIRNLIETNPIIWHCTSCRDTNPHFRNEKLLLSINYTQQKIIQLYIFML